MAKQIEDVMTPEPHHSPRQRHNHGRCSDDAGQ